MSFDKTYNPTDGWERQQGGQVLAGGPNATLDLTSVPATQELYSTADSITALAGGGQTGATLLTKSINRVTTVATAADSVMLPPSVAGAQITVINAAASNAMAVFPSSGEKINALSADASLSVAANKTVTFVCCTAGQWHSLLTA